MKRHKEPFPWPYRITEAVVNCKVKLRWCKDAMKEIFQFCTVDSGQFVRGNNLNICQQVGSIMSSIGDTRFNLAARNTYLVNQLSVF